MSFFRSFERQGCRSSGILNDGDIVLPYFFANSKPICIAFRFRSEVGLYCFPLLPFLESFLLRFLLFLPGKASAIILVEIGLPNFSLGNFRERNFVGIFSYHSRVFNEGSINNQDSVFIQVKEICHMLPELKPADN